MTVSSYGVGVYRAGEAHCLTEPTGARRTGANPGVLLFHGHGGDARQWQPANSGPGLHTHRLAELGMTCLSTDAGGVAPWADDDEMAAGTAGHDYLVNVAKVAGSRIYVVGWSMGGLAALNWVKRNPTLVAAAVVFAPAVDVAYFHDTAAGKATYGPEIEAAYGGAAAWQAGIAGHSPAAEPAAYRGLPPVRVFHGDADTTVPVTLSQTFVTAVASANLTLTVKAGADHVSVLAATDPVGEVAAFLRARPVT